MSLFTVQQQFASVVPSSAVPGLAVTRVCQLPDLPQFCGHRELYVNAGYVLFYRGENSQIVCARKQHPVLQKLDGSREMLAMGAFPDLGRLLADKALEVQALNLKILIQKKIVELYEMENNALYAYEHKG